MGGFPKHSNFLRGIEMASFKCKMCGGGLDIEVGTYIATCDYCGTKQTVPGSHDEITSNLFNRANNLRLKCEFDKAEQVYEKILDIDNTNSEAHWGIVLCKYGIEYVEDPKTYKRIPTCHRTLYESVLADVDYLAAVENASGEQKELYISEAGVIDKLQRDILDIVNKEKPFDVFICYKETDENGKRTIDSALGNDIYYQLTQEGFKVFYAPITLEEKLGYEYEPYIFAALNSAKVMLVLGTRPEFFDAVWVRNEWSRFLKLAKTDRSKLLIPCYRDMDTYELPEEFSHLQAQDMGRIGFINDLTRGIKKVILSNEKPKAAVKETVISGGASEGALLKRAFLFLEDCDWDSAREYCDKVLDINPENGRAYLCKLMAELRIIREESLKDLPETFEDNGDFQKAVRFGDDKLKSELKGYIEHIKTRNELERLDSLYAMAEGVLAAAKTEAAYKNAARYFEDVGDYRDAAAKVNECLEKAEIARKDAIIAAAVNALQREYIEACELAIAELATIPDYKNAAEISFALQKRIEEIKKKEAAVARKRKIKILIAVIALAVAAIVAIIIAVINKYNSRIVSISAGGFHSVYVERGGGVTSYGYNGDTQCDVYDWDNIIMASAGGYHTVGLKSDGTVVATGYNNDGQCNISDWKDVVAVEAGNYHTVGLKADGTVVATGYNNNGQCNVSDWKDIVAVSAGTNYTIGLKSDGTVVAVGNNSYNQCDISSWKDIVAISAGDKHTIGLKSDGTVVAVGYIGSERCAVTEWTDIVAISAGYDHTVGLKADGTVVAVGNNNYGQLNVTEWTDVVAISTGNGNTEALTSDGTVLRTDN